MFSAVGSQVAVSLSGLRAGRACGLRATDFLLYFPAYAFFLFTYPEETSL
jgi:hypothetical protein